MSQKSKKINFILIGAQKSGTTYLHKLMMSHPEIEMPNEEIPYFQYPDFEAIDNIEFSLAQLFKTRKIKGIKRPNYIGQEESPILIEEYGKGEIKLIAVLRDPVERFISAFFHIVKHSWLTPFFINLKIKNIINGKRGKPVLLNLIEYGMYSKYLDKYQKTIKKENLFVLDYNFLTSNPQSAFNYVCDFLEIKRFELDSKTLEEPSNVGSKSFIDLLYGHLKSRLMFRFDRKIQRLHTKDSHTKLNKFLRKLVDKIYFEISKFEKLKNNIQIKDENKQRLRELYSEDQKKLKKFKVVRE